MFSIVVHCRSSIREELVQCFIRPECDKEPGAVHPWLVNDEAGEGARRSHRPLKRRRGRGPFVSPTTVGVATEDGVVVRSRAELNGFRPGEYTFSVAGRNQARKGAGRSETARNRAAQLNPRLKMEPERPKPRLHLVPYMSRPYESETPCWRLQPGATTS